MPSKHEPLIANRPWTERRDGTGGVTQMVGHLRSTVQAAWASCSRDAGSYFRPPFFMILSAREEEELEGG
jgi:hypothetical protein